MKKILALAAALLFSTILFGQNAECKFKQTKFIKASGKTIESEGNLVVSSSDKMEMNYTNPKGDYFIIDGKTMKINIKGKKSVIDTDKNAAMRAQRNTLMNCISGNWKQAAADNKAETSVTEKGSNKIVTLTAKKAATRGYAKIIITYRKSDNMPVEMVMEEFNGTTTTYKMSNIVKK